LIRTANIVSSVKETSIENNMDDLASKEFKKYIESNLKKGISLRKLDINFDNNVKNKVNIILDVDD
jgi:hypothetical protein